MLGVLLGVLLGFLGGSPAEARPRGAAGTHCPAPEAQPGPVEPPPRYLGADFIDAREVVEKILVAEEGEIAERGAVVVLMRQGGPIHQAGLRHADVIIELGGRRVDVAPDLLIILGSRPVGTSLPVTFVRDGQLETTSLRVSLPEPGPPAQSFRVADP